MYYELVLINLLKLCAVLNSLEVTRELLDEFSTDMEKMSKDVCVPIFDYPFVWLTLKQDPGINQALKPTFTTMKTICDELDDVLLTKVCPNENKKEPKKKEKAK